MPAVFVHWQGLSQRPWWLYLRSSPDCFRLSLRNPESRPKRAMLIPSGKKAARAIGGGLLVYYERKSFRTYKKDKNLQICFLSAGENAGKMYYHCSPDALRERVVTFRKKWENILQIREFFVDLCHDQLAGPLRKGRQPLRKAEFEEHSRRRSALFLAGWTFWVMKSV